MHLSALEPKMEMIKAILILDNDGKRLYAKYYDHNLAYGISGAPLPPTLGGISNPPQGEFERKLFQKTYKANSEIVMLDNNTIVYRSTVDVFFYVIGSSDENELILSNVLNCLYDSVGAIMKIVERSSIMSNLSSVIQIIDEICDSGIVLECDHTLVLSRTAIKGAAAGGEGAPGDLLAGDQTVSQVLSNAKEQLKWSLLR
ncbi:coatomer subunit zeta-1-like [Symsagittifera roscoffensis]|uniref:coatomer subunit zeta-1-like n=1 Tax=Symsagittifera roscoffensis TaxID=84072 RepID=UPI00307C6E2B